MRTRSIAILLGILLPFPVAALAAVGPAQGAEDDVYYVTEVGFADGSSLITRADTGTQQVTPATDGTPGDARAAQQSGAVTTTSAGTATDSDDVEELPPGADSGEDTVRAQTPIDPNGGHGPGSGDVVIQADTPDGFHLYGTNTTAYGYIYTSDYLATKLSKCVNGSCEVIGRVDNRFKEYLYGGSSIRWKITPSSVYRFGPVYSIDFEYWCGVNLSWQSDITCRTDDSTADSSGIDYTLASWSVGNNSYPIIKSFGSGHADKAKYPLIEMRTTWPGYPVTVTERFRGWDIRRFSGVWQMSPVSGTGY
jgi:hypothetical protein